MKFFLKSALVAGLMIFGLNVFAQTVDEAGQKFNAANEQFKANAFSQAVPLYEQALKAAKAAGPDAADLQAKIEDQLVNAYFKNGISNYKKRQFDQAIAQLRKSKDLAKSIQNAKFVKLGTTYIARVYSTKGLVAIKKKDYANASAQFAEALKEKPNCVNAIYGNSLVAKGQGNMDEMMTLVDKLGEMGATNSRAAKTYAKAKNMAFRTLLNNGASELQKEHASKALTYLKDAEKYHSGTAMLYYYKAIANLKMNKWNAAIDDAKKAIAIEKNDKSDIYFTLGQAYQGKGDNTNACKAFKSVVKGPNVAAAKYQIKEVLKCK
jgi:tetratricopeptide (TPR) repeat protein